MKPTWQPSNLVEKDSRKSSTSKYLKAVSTSSRYDLNNYLQLTSKEICYSSSTLSGFPPQAS